MPVSLVEVETGRVVLPDVEVAALAVQRAMGLIGRRHFGNAGGLWLEPCNGVHTWGVRFPIDVVALDAAGGILKTWERVRPFRICLPVARGRAVLELPAGMLSSLNLDRAMRYRLLDSPQ